VTTPAVRETWRLCTQHAGYLVSDQGRVRRIGGGILKPQRNTKGYLKISLGRGRQRLVHRLVAEAFHGPGPAGHDVDHLNWDRKDNRAANLRWLHHLENAVRWNGWDGKRIVWAVRADEKLAGPPEGHAPMTREEQEALGDELVAAGWAVA